jgi:hypothetical protein
MLKYFEKMKKIPLQKIAFLQASGLALYTGLVALLMWKGNTLFGPINNFLGPLLFLLLFVVSAIVSALIVLGYPFILFWEEKKTKEALRLVAQTTLWLIIFIILILIILILF